MVNSVIIVFKRYSNTLRMLRLTKNVALPTMRCFSSRITIDNINQHIRTADYAVRGEVVLRAIEIDNEMKKGKKFPFDNLLYCNVGNPQAIKQKPITFLREVLCITSWPEVAEKHPEMFHPDALQRAKELLIANPGGSGAYSNTNGVPKVCEDVAKYIEKRDGYPCDPKNIFLTNGASQAIQDTLKLLIDKPTDCILIPIPQYPLYSASIHIFGGQYEPYYLSEKNDWALDVADIEKSIKSARAKGLTVKAIAAVNPGNPTGKCFSRKNIEDICKICARENIAILADEVYQENIYRPGDKFISFKKVMCDLKLDCQLVSFHSTSKGYWGECGRRGGYLEMVNFPEDVRAELYKLLSICCCSNVDGQYTMDVMINPPKPGDASYELFEKEKNGILDSLKIRAKKLSTALNKLDGVSCLSVDGALYTYFRLTMPPKAIEAAKKQGKAADLMYCLDLLNEAGVVCVPGSGFGQEEGTYHVRSTILPPMNEIDQVVERMNTFHKKWMARYQ